jgi:DNA repair exonuclease SbcCD ATPase subunit
MPPPPAPPATLPNADEAFAEDALRRAVSAWAELHPESVLASATGETERQLADARAAADVASREQGIRAHEAEQDAMRWKAQYEEKERDLVFAKEQLEVARRNADAGLPTGQYRVEEERRAAVFEAEALLHRLRQGEARANADAEAAAREIDSLRARLRDYENGGGVGGDLAAGNNRVAALQAEIDMKAGEILHMQTQVKHDTARLKLELDAAKRAIHERDVALTQFSTEYDKATADAYRFAADLSSTSHSLDEARGVIVERDRIIQETNDELGTRTHDLEERTRERDEARHNTWEREQDIENLTKERDEARHHLWEREQELDRTRHDLEHERHVIGQRDNELKEKHEELVRTYGERDEANDKVRDRDGLLEQRQREIDGKNHELEERRIELERAHEHHDHVSSDLEARIADLEARINDAEAQRDALGVELAGVVAELETKTLVADVEQHRGLELETRLVEASANLTSLDAARVAAATAASEAAERLRLATEALRQSKEAAAAAVDAASKEAELREAISRAEEDVAAQAAAAWNALDGPGDQARAEIERLEGVVRTLEGETNDLRERMRVGYETSQQELADVKAQANAAAEEGRARIRALEQSMHNCDPIPEHLRVGGGGGGGGGGDSQREIEELRERLRVGYEAAQREIQDVKAQANAAAEEGRGRIRALEEQLARGGGGDGGEDARREIEEVRAAAARAKEEGTAKIRGLERELEECRRGAADNAQPVASDGLKRPTDFTGAIKVKKSYDW